MRRPCVPSDDCYSFSTPYRTEVQECDRSARDSIDHLSYWGRLASFVVNVRRMREHPPHARSMGRRERAQRLLAIVDPACRPEPLALRGSHARRVDRTPVAKGRRRFRYRTQFSRAQVAGRAPRRGGHAALHRDRATQGLPIHRVDRSPRCRRESSGRGGERRGRRHPTAFSSPAPPRGRRKGESSAGRFHRRLIHRPLIYVALGAAAIALRRRSNSFGGCMSSSLKHGGRSRVPRPSNGREPRD